MLRNSAGSYLRGRMFGPGLLPQMLQALSCLRAYEIPVIGGCGIYDQTAMDAAISAGATAVQLDAVLWRGWETENSS